MAENGVDPSRPSAQPPVFRAPKQVSRPKAVIVGDPELGTELKLGEFENDHALSVSEARAVITAVHGARAKRDPATNPLGGDKVHNDSEPIVKFGEYVNIFSRFKVPENLQALSNLLESHHELAPIERAQLGSLCCDTADEAKTLIPSIANKISDASLQEMLEEMARLQDRFT